MQLSRNSLVTRTAGSRFHFRCALCGETSTKSCFKHAEHCPLSDPRIETVDVRPLNYFEADRLYNNNPYFNRVVSSVVDVVKTRFVKKEHLDHLFLAIRIRLEELWRSRS